MPTPGRSAAATRSRCPTTSSTAPTHPSRPSARSRSGSPTASPEAWSASVPPGVRLVLASTSAQRRAILTQLAIAFEAVAPAYQESPGGDPLEHAAGKARSVDGGGRPVLGVDTVVVCDGHRIGKPADAAEAEAILTSLSGRSHEVVSGLCLRGPGFEELRPATTRVVFRRLPAAEIERYLASGEWAGRAGGYAIQGLGAGLVERIEGDYLNVVGLPGALLVELLAQRLPGLLGYGRRAEEDG